MKFYNPFKAHIVQDANNKYWVRYLSWAGWMYIDRNGSDWCGRSWSDEYYSITSARDALFVYHQRQERKRKIDTVENNKNVVKYVES